MTKPYLVVEWNDTETDAQGWLVVHNFMKGYTERPEDVKQVFLMIIKLRMPMLY
jgi:hypothetical protein